MKTELRKLSIDDGMDVYRLLQQIPAEENGYRNDAYGLSIANYHRWLRRKCEISQGINLPDWMVPSTEYWFYVDDVPVGNIRIRHTLNEELRQRGGHIGYAIALRYRHRGYGKLMLKAMLKEAFEQYSLTAVMLSTESDNTASRHIIESCKGQWEKETEGYITYWIALTHGLTLKEKAAYEMIG